MEDREKTDGEEINQSMDLSRTNQLFDAAIHSGDSLSGKPYNEEAVKAQRIVLGFGNLHVKSAQTKLSAIRLTGYRNELNNLRHNVQKKVRQMVKSTEYPSDKG